VIRIEKLHALTPEDRARVARAAGLQEKIVDLYGGVATTAAQRAAIERAAAQAGITLPTSSVHLDGPNPVDE
jgi:hypothetical protein